MLICFFPDEIETTVNAVGISRNIFQRGGKEKMVTVDSKIVSNRPNISSNTELREQLGHEQLEIRFDETHRESIVTVLLKHHGRLETQLIIRFFRSEAPKSKARLYNRTITRGKGEHLLRT